MAVALGMSVALAVLGAGSVIFIIVNIFQYLSIRKTKMKVRKLKNEIMAAEILNEGGVEGSPSRRVPSGKEDPVVDVRSRVMDTVTRALEFLQRESPLTEEMNSTLLIDRLDKLKDGNVIDVLEEIVPQLPRRNNPRLLSTPSQGITVHTPLAHFIASLASKKEEKWEKLAAIALEMARGAIGLPDSFVVGGNFVESVGDGLLWSMVTAKERKNREILGLEGNDYGRMGEEDREKAKKHMSKMVVYASDQAHSYLRTAVDITSLNIRKIPTIKQLKFSLIPELLEEEILKDLSVGMVPTMIVATLGSYGSMGMDQIQGLAKLAEKYQCWLHVDGSTVGGFWLDGKNRPIGLEEADSVGVEMPFGGTDVVWTKDQKLWEQSTGPDQFDPILNSLKLLLPFHLMGSQEMIKRMNMLISFAEKFETFISNHPNLRIFVPRLLNSVSFQYYVENIDRSEWSTFTDELCTLINETHKVTVGKRIVNGVVVLVITVGSHWTKEGMIDEMWQEIKEVVEEFTKKKASERLSTEVESSKAEESKESSEK